MRTSSTVTLTRQSLLFWQRSLGALVSLANTGSTQRGCALRLRRSRAGIMGVIVGLLFAAAVAWAAGGEKTITGVISKVDPKTRIATVTPASGPPIVVQFAFNAGGPCDACLGSGRSRPTFAETVTEGSTWTLTYTTSLPEGAATWFPGGTVNTVQRAVAVKAQ